MLPDQFLKCLADAECSVQSWDAVSCQLKLAIEKEIGPESGLLILTGVSFVHLPPRFTIFAVTSSKVEVPDFPGVRPEDDEWLYVFQGSWDRSFYVLAEDARYQLPGE